ncbi:cation:proton antiporter, partial [Nocardia otitidiscaviarum]|nr:cation:proton antiporter [Nocardia otitidiscaviarum]
LAVAAGAVPAEFAALATTYVLLMAVLGPIAARVVEPLLRTFTPPVRVSA